MGYIIRVRGGDFLNKNMEIANSNESMKNNTAISVDEAEHISCCSCGSDGTHKIKECYSMKKELLR